MQFFFQTQGRIGNSGSFGYNAVIHFKNCLVFSEEKLTAVLVEDLFKPGLSPGGSNRRVTEERIIGYWMDFLQDAEGRATS